MRAKNTREPRESKYTLKMNSLVVSPPPLRLASSVGMTSKCCVLPTVRRSIQF